MPDQDAPSRGVTIPFCPASVPNSNLAGTRYLKREQLFGPNLNHYKTQDHYKQDHNFNSTNPVHSNHYVRRQPSTQHQKKLGLIILLYYMTSIFAQCGISFLKKKMVLTTAVGKEE